MKEKNPAWAGHQIKGKRNHQNMTKTLIRAVTHQHHCAKLVPVMMIPAWAVGQSQQLLQIRSNARKQR